MGVMLLVAACGGGGAAHYPQDSGTRRALGKLDDPTSEAAKQAPALKAQQVTIVPGGTFGPYVSRSGDSSILVWATHDDKGKGQWHSLALRAPVGPNQKPVALAEAPAELSLVAVRHASNANDHGYVVVAGEPNGDIATVHAMLLGSEGQLAGGPFRIAETEGRLLWLDAVPTENGPLVLWAVSSRGLAELYAAKLDEARAVHKVASDALAWQAAPFEAGAAVATVSQNGVQRDVGVRFLDGLGKTQGTPLVIRARSLAQLDLDMANIGGHLVLAWSEQSHLEPTLFGAAVDKTGRISQPAKRLTAPMGEQALVRVVPPAAGQSQGYVLWENINQSRGVRRLLQVAPLLSNATLGNSRATLEMHGDASTLPEFVASSTGLAALSQAPICLKPPKPCEDAPLLPTYVEFDQRLNVVASEPFRLTETDGDGIDLAWGLTCGKAGCNALAAPRSGPAPIYWVELARVSDVFAPAAKQTDDSVRPRLAANEALQEVDALADLEALPNKSAELVSWVTYFDPTLPYEIPKTPAPDGRYAPVRALLQTLDTSELKNEPTNISLRARSLGGVALAPAKANDFLLGWTAIDKKEPQVFVTLVSAEGKRKALKMLTNTPGEVSEVALARLDNGWVTAWVDERHQDPEVYAIKISDTLVPLSPERRITEMAGTAADLSVIELGKQVLVVWGDSRASKQQGFADVYTRLLDPNDLTPRGQDMPLEQSPGHSHSIHVSRIQDGAVVAWLENGTSTSPPEVRFVKLSSEGSKVGDLQRLEVPAKTLSGLALDCQAEACHLVLGGAAEGKATLWAATILGAQSPHLTRLTTLSGSPAQQTMPTLSGEIVLLAEQSPEGQTRLRRLHVQWE